MLMFLFLLFFNALKRPFQQKKKKKSSLGVVRGGIYHWTVNHGKTDEKDVYLCCAKRALVEKNGEGVHGGDRVHC